MKFKSLIIGIVFILFLLSGNKINAQTIYFPPLSGSAWDTIQPQTLGWCTDSVNSLYQMLDDNNSKAFMILKDGKIVIEKYFDNFTKDSLWYWASAGKSLAGFTVGLAQEDGFLDIGEPSSNYLGQGWTDLPAEKEDLISIRHQLSMTTGLDDMVPDNNCTIDSCLKYKADAGERWAYHNAPYTLVHQVIEAAVGKSVNAYIFQKISAKTGIIGSYVPIDYDDIFFSTARSMARFGLLIMNKGKWDQTQIMTDQDYFYDMINPSNPINPSYGYLWWLNGQEKYMLPSLQIMFPGSLIPAAPAEMYCAEGKNGQIINVIPSQGLVIVRMGETPDGGGAISIDLNRKIWDKINNLACQTNVVSDLNDAAIDIYPNPGLSGNMYLKMDNPDALIEWKLLNASGIQLKTGNKSGKLSLDGIPAGIYTMIINSKENIIVRKIVIQ